MVRKQWIKASLEGEAWACGCPLWRAYGRLLQQIQQETPRMEP